MDTSSVHPHDFSSGWYGVRCIFRHTDLDSYEERITIWKGDGLKHATELAEIEAREYASTLDGVQYAGLAQAYEMTDPPGHGGEVFSLMRDSDLPGEEYLNAFFDTGTERHTHL
jgi:hypothetical protein